VAARVYARSGVFVRPLSPVIVQARPGALPQVSAAIRQRGLGRMLRFGPFKGIQPTLPTAFSAMREIPAFNMHAAVLDAVTITDLAQSPYVAAIYDDPVVRISQFPSVPPEGAWALEVPSATGRGASILNFTSTEWTRRLLGADAANAAGYSGQGVRAGVVDTGGWIHPMTRRSASLTAIPGNRFDVISHGCIEGGAYVRTTFCGVATMQELFDRSAALWGSAPSEVGDTVIPHERVWVQGFDVPSGTERPTIVRGIHRIPHRGKLVHVRASNGRTYLTTPWHPFLLRDRRSGRYWYCRADELPHGQNHYLVAPRGAAGGDLPGTEILSEHENYLVGLYIAEGCLTREPRGEESIPRLLFGLHPDEVPILVGHLRRVGFGATIHSPNTVRLFGPGLIRRLIALGFRVGGRKAASVTIPEPLLKQGRRALLAILAGIVDGDGSVDTSGNRPGVRVATSSHDLAKQLVTLVTSLGYSASLHPSGTRAGMSHTGPTGRVITARSDGWHVTILGESSIRFWSDIRRFMVLHGDRRAPQLATNSWKAHKSLVWIRSTELVDFNGYLYDLTTDTENYAAGRQGVVYIHNTWCLSALGGTRFYDETLSAAVGAPVYCEGMAPQCGLLAIKALDFVIGTAPTSILLAGLAMALAQRVDVLSLSWGSPVTAASPQADPFYPAMQALDAAGVLVFCASGNSGPGPLSVDTPGALPQPVTVGGYNAVANRFNSLFGAAGELADFSGRGPTPWGSPKPDCVAPGAIIDSGVSPFSQMAVSYLNRPHAASALAGTSMATPLAAGLGVLARQLYAAKVGKGLTSAEFKAMLAATGYPNPNQSGYGVPTWGRVLSYVNTQYGVSP
jgi:subtilisin family serine protease